VTQFFVSSVWLVPLLPLLGGAAAALFGSRLRSNAHLPVVVGIALAFLVSLGALFSSDPGATTVAASWLSVSDLEVPIDLRVDGLTTMMLSMVTLVSGLVAVFAAGYMAGDPGYPRFFALIGLFVFSMTSLVLSNNFLLTYVFWELVGVCSYLLIGYWHTRPAAAAAAMKAFLVNRIGDFGFAVAIFWLWSVVPYHDLSYDHVLDPATLSGLPAAAVVGIPLLLFWAATAKSAQIPLYVWLPDAMEGPTPVSALIHAATMVTAGVYLMARSMPLLVLAPGVQLLICATGCATSLLAAAIAVTQYDLKRVMAYSTVSQLGFMFMALGAGVGGLAQLAVVSAMFHLFTHAFFKALLFLASGSVMHAMGDVIDMRRFGGLRQRMPVTCWTFAVGGLALAGMFPLAGFWSKDEILAVVGAASGTAGGGLWAYSLIYWTAILVGFLTAFYTARAFFMTFFGPEKLPSPDDPEAEPAAWDGNESHALARDAGGAHAGGGGAHGDGDPEEGAHGHEMGHESPPIMTYPLLVLAGFSALVGLVFGPTHWFEHHLAGTLGFEGLGHGSHDFDWFTAIVSTLAGLGGIGLAFGMYAVSGTLPARLAERAGGLVRASRRKFYVDEIYDWVVVKPIRALAVVCEFLDVYLIDNLVLAVARAPRKLGRDLLAGYQNGLIQFYAAASALGTVVLLLVLLLLS